MKVTVSPVPHFCSVIRSRRRPFSPYFIVMRAVPLVAASCGATTVCRLERSSMTSL